jgi:hypothetical protein
LYKLGRRLQGLTSIKPNKHYILVHREYNTSNWYITKLNFKMDLEMLI